MNRKALITSLVIGFGVLVLQTSAFAAAVAFSGTTADWTNFETSMTVNYYDLYSIAIAEAEANYDRADQVRNDIRTWGSVSSVNPLVNTQPYGYTTPDTEHAEGSAEADGVDTIESFASAYVERGGYFTVPAAGTFNLSIPYAFSQEVSLDPATDSAYADAMASIWFAEQLGPTAYSTLASKQIMFNHSNANGNWGATGTLTLDSGVGILPDRNYVFNVVTFAAAYAQTPNAVPEPASLSLLGLGLLGLAFKRKKLR